RSSSRTPSRSSTGRIAPRPVAASPRCVRAAPAAGVLVWSSGAISVAPPALSAPRSSLLTLVHALGGALPAELVDSMCVRPIRGLLTVRLPIGHRPALAGLDQRSGCGEPTQFLEEAEGVPPRPFGGSTV